MTTRNPLVRDYMGNASPAWVDPTTYKVTFEALGGVVDGPNKQAATRRIQISPALLVSGSIDVGDVGTLNPIKHLDESVENERPPLANATYEVVLLDAAGTVLESRGIGDGGFVEVVHGVNEDPNEPFNTFLPVDIVPFSITFTDDPSATRIELKKGDLVLASVDKSDAIPIVENLVSSERDDLPPNTFELGWTASDADPGQTEILTFDVLYTPDDGETLVPIAANLPETTVLVFASFLPASDDGKYVVRASDGWNQGELISKLAVAVNDHEPTIRITYPGEDQRLSVEHPVLLAALAFDREDTAIPDESIVWSLSTAEVLGTGSEIFVQLPLGFHRIQVEVTDSFGHSAFDEVAIEIVEAPDSETFMETWMLH